MTDLTDAEQLAAHYDYDVDALKFQYDRRSFGSFALGRERERDRFYRAWQFARKRREAQEIRDGALLRARDAMEVGDIEKASGILARVLETAS